MKTYRESKPRKVTPPSPSYMNNDQFANYLSDLRSHRSSRPGGARPPPAAGAAPTSRSRYSVDAAQRGPDHYRTPSQAPSHAPSTAAASFSSRYSTATAGGRDYYPSQPVAAPLKPSQIVPTATYMERGQRWMEKEEAFSLRDAMEEMSIRDAPQQQQQPQDNEDSRIYEAALNEASELVWQHQNGAPPPRPDGAYRYRPHLRKNSYAHARAASIGDYGEDIAATGLNRDIGYRSVSGSSSGSDGARMSAESGRGSSMGSRRKTYGGVGGGNNSYHRRKSSMKRNISGEIDRPFSGDQIWEEPGTSPQRSDPAPATQPLVSASQNPALRFQVPSAGEKRLDRVEIHRNPPTRSRNAQYTMNGQYAAAQDPEEVRRKNGVEIRSDDIRNATSMRLKDRSARLPEPSAVSDSPGRPIVSFDSNWQAPRETADTNSDRPVAATAPLNIRKQAKQQQHQHPMGIPSISVGQADAPKRPSPPQANVPTICVGDDSDSQTPSVPTINVPTIAVDEAPSVPTINVPTINIPGDDSNKDSNSRPLPSTSNRKPQVGLSKPPRGHFSLGPAIPGRARTLCHECGFPIEGRFVSLAGIPQRFHPQCFSCFSCGTGLEAMEISPEPDAVRNARVDRIRRRQAGETLEEVPGETAQEDGDDRLRFYCHLDWHEQFAPRCKHCKTPILGEHVVALGEHWHNGHFFCAECGDPFEHGMTHIEKDGYAWCINCQTKRTERKAPKCKRCKVAVIGQYVQAIGYEWHEGCFRCAECNGGFDDGQIFPREGETGMVVLCTGCRMAELKS